MYEWEQGPIPRHWTVDHTCGEKDCLRSPGCGDVGGEHQPTACPGARATCRPGTRGWCRLHARVRLSQQRSRGWRRLRARARSSIFPDKRQARCWSPTAMPTARPRAATPGSRRTPSAKTRAARGRGRSLARRRAEWTGGRRWPATLCTLLSDCHHCRQVGTSAPLPWSFQSRRQHLSVRQAPLVAVAPPPCGT